MKKPVMMMAVFFITVSSVSAGEDNRKTAIFVNFGMSGALAPDEFDKTDAPGLNSGCEFGYRLSSLITSTVFFNRDNFELDSPESRLTGELIAYSYGLNIWFYLNRRTREPRPYLVAGFGYTRFGGSAHYRPGMTRPVDFTDWAGDETAETITFAAGLEFYLSESLCLFADIGYRTAFADNRRVSFLPVRMGLAFY